MNKERVEGDFGFSLGRFEPVVEDFFPLSERDQQIVDDFHRLYFRLNEKKPGLLLSWLGYQTGKLPSDLWVYQELMFKLRPDLIIECGTHRGGSALFLSNMCQLLDCGRVVTVDLYPKENRPSHELLTYIQGSSIDPSTFAQVRSHVKGGDIVLVILDSDHSEEHVSQELSLYSQLVTVGSYLVVEDTFLNGHPSHHEFGPGPMEALRQFDADNKHFIIDRGWEKFLFTLNRSGFFKRISDAQSED